MRDAEPLALGPRRPDPRILRGPAGFGFRKPAVHELGFALAVSAPAKVAAALKICIGEWQSASPWRIDSATNRAEIAGQPKPLLASGARSFPTLHVPIGIRMNQQAANAKRSIRNGPSRLHHSMSYARWPAGAVVNRPAGGDRAKKWERAPYDWYREQAWCVEQIMAAIDFGQDLIWDPTCGMGNTLDVAAARGHPTIGSDIIDRMPRHRFFRANILRLSRAPTPPEGHALSVICNPPYSYIEDIAERVIRAVLCFNVRRAAFIVPIAFLAGQERRRFFTRDFRPSHTAIYSQRPTMPPGHMIEELAKPFEGGMQDYACLIYTRPHRWRTETIWLGAET